MQQTFGQWRTFKLGLILFFHVRPDSKYRFNHWDNKNEWHDLDDDILKNEKTKFHITLYYKD